MPIFTVKTPQHAYQNVVERGIVRRIAEFIPARAGKLFVVTTEDVWRLHGEKLKGQFAGKSPEVLFFPGGEANKRLSVVEGLAEQMVDRGLTARALSLVLAAALSPMSAVFWQPSSCAAFRFCRCRPRCWLRWMRVRVVKQA